MAFLRDIWYPAGWASELNDQLLGRTLLDQMVLLFRDANGTARAIGGRCPHRFAPLHLGTKFGDAVECAYHGFRFDGTGRCVLVPDEEGPIPGGMRVPGYPLVERDRVLWIWFGDVDKADPALIPDLSERLSNPKYVALTGTIVIKANYELVADNLIDARHGQFLHASVLKGSGFYEAPHEITHEGHTVQINRLIKNTTAPSTYARFLPDPTIPVDWFTTTRWDPPGIFQLDNGCTPAGCDRDAGVRRPGVHLLCPETETSTHYFYASVRNYNLDDPVADEASREWQRIVFEEQDKVMLEAVQQAMGTTDFLSLHPVLLRADNTATRLRNTMRELLRKEEASRKSVAS
jgi:phenylpropionate dioxygenase-like ring-hydroxylating dioxygenase large terminal subunit